MNCNWKWRTTPVICHILRTYIARRTITSIMNEWNPLQILIIEGKASRLVSCNQIDSVERKYLPISNLLRDAFSYCRNPSNVAKYYITLVLSSNNGFKFYVIPRDWEQIKQ